MRGIIASLVLITWLLLASDTQGLYHRRVPEVSRLARHDFEDELLRVTSRRDGDDDGPPEGCLLEEETVYNSAGRTDCEYFQSVTDTLLSIYEGYLGSRGLEGEALEQAKSELQSWLTLVLDIDIFDEEQRRELACQLADAESVRDAAYILHMPQTTFLTYYMRWKSFFDVIGGARNLEKRLNVAVTLGNRLREMTSQMDRNRDLNLTRVAEYVTHRQLVGLLRDLDDEFGPGFLIYLTFQPYDEKLLVVDLGRWATALLGPIDDVPCLTGLHVEKIRELWRTVQMLLVTNSLRPIDTRVLAWAAITLEDLGLLDLTL